MYKNKKNHKEFLSILILCTLLFNLTFQMNPGFIRKDINNNLRSSAEYVPAGLIALWSGPLSAIPAGWKLSDGTGGTINTTNRFIRSTGSMESPGATGGSTSHNHSYDTVPYHDHGVTYETLTPHYHTYDRPTNYRNKGTAPLLPSFTALSISYTSTGYNSALHSHNVQATGGTGLYMSEEEDFIPPYSEMAFIEKETNDPTIPIGLIVMWTGNIDTIPAGWELSNGSNGTPDLREKFIRGAPPGEDPGTLGGNVAHDHTYTQIPSHTHSTDTGGASHNHGGVRGADSNRDIIIPENTVYSSQTGYTRYENVDHDHTVPYVGQVSGTTQNTDNLPPNFKVAFIMNTVVSNALPIGAISMWGDSIANIPPGWNQCDGTSNTPNLLNKFPRGVPTGEQPGIVGGSAIHRHRYTEVPRHRHSVYSDPMRHRHSIRTRLGTGINSVTGTVDIFSSGWGSSTTDYSDPFIDYHNHDINPYGSSFAYSWYTNNLPPYVKLIYIQKGLSMSNRSPEDGATDISYNPLLSVDVNDLQGDDLNVSFYNNPSDAMIGWDFIVGGTGTASVTWSGRSSGTSYSWYVKTDDGLSVEQYDPWSFTTNYVPNAPTNPVPSDLAYDVEANPTLSVDVFDDDGDTLTVTFYNASDDSLIDADIVFGGTGTASVIWSGVTSEMVSRWYVIADDGLSTTQSPTWTFTTYDEASIPPGIPLPGLIPLGLIVIGTTGILSVITYLRRRKSLE